MAYETEEVVNRYGFTDFVHRDLPDMPICSDCHAFKLPNRGDGTLCSECQHRLNVEFELDYAQGMP